MLRDHEQTHGHHVVILVLVVGAGSISCCQHPHLEKPAYPEPVSPPHYGKAGKQAHCLCDQPGQARRLGRG